MNNELYQARIAINVICLVLTNKNDADVLAYVGNLTAALRDLFGCNFVNWEHISDICDQLEYSITDNGRQITIDKSTFNEIINAIQAHFDMEFTQLLDQLD